MSFLIQPPDLSAYLPLAGGVMTGELTLPAGAVGAPSLMFTGAGATTGFYSPLANGIAAAISGTRRFWIDSAGTVSFTNTSFTSNGILSNAGNIRTGNASTISWSSTVDPTAAQDVILRRDGPGALAVRDGTNAQSFSVYGTADSGLTNYERLKISAQQGVGFTIAAETLGTGADNLDIGIVPAGTGLMRYGTHNAIGAETVTGFINIKDSGGTTRKLAVVS